MCENVHLGHVQEGTAENSFVMATTSKAAKSTDLAVTSFFGQFTYLVDMEDMG